MTDRLLQLVYAPQQPPAKWDLASHLRLQDYLAATAAKDPFRTVPQRHHKAVECDVCAALTRALSAATQSTRKSTLQMQVKVVAAVLDTIQQLTSQRTSLTAVASAKGLLGQLVSAVDFLCSQQLPELALRCAAVLSGIGIESEEGLTNIVQATGIAMLVRNLHVLGSSGTGPDQDLVAILKLLQAATQDPARCQQLADVAGGLSQLKTDCYTAPKWPGDATTASAIMPLVSAAPFFRMVCALGVGRAVYSCCTGLLDRPAHIPPPTASRISPISPTNQRKILTTSYRAEAATSQKSPTSPKFPVSPVSPGHGLALIFKLLETRDDPAVVSRCLGVVKTHCESPEIALSDLLQLLVLHCDAPSSAAACTVALAGIEVLLETRVGAESYSMAREALLPVMKQVIMNGASREHADSATEIVEFFDAWEPDWEAADNRNAALIKEVCAEVQHTQAVPMKVQSTCTVSSYQMKHTNNPRLAESRHPTIKLTSPAMHESESDSATRKCHDDSQTSQQQISCEIEPNIEPNIEPDTQAITEPNNGSPASTNSTANNAGAKQITVQHADAGGHNAGAKQIQTVASSTASSLGVEAIARFRALDSNGDGELDEFELSNGLADLGMSDEEINGVLFELDADADGKVA